MVEPDDVQLRNTGADVLPRTSIPLRYLQAHARAFVYK
jgi:hypothetical protein